MRGSTKQKRDGEKRGIEGRREGEVKNELQTMRGNGGKRAIEMNRFGKTKRGRRVFGEGTSRSTRVSNRERFHISFCVALSLRAGIKLEISTIYKAPSGFGTPST